MLYILDTADIEAIKHCSEFYPLAGVTTNPSIIAKEKTDFWKLTEDIRKIIGEEKMLHIQTTQTKAEKIAEEAELIRKRIGGELYIKVPISEEGLKATMFLKDMGIKVTMTAIFTAAQALISARAGADFVAPYVNRLDNITADGAGVVSDIAEEFMLHDMDCRILAASFKNAEQVNKCALAGCHAVTVSADVLEALISHPMTDLAVMKFTSDWEGAYGKKTILDF